MAILCSPNLFFFLSHLLIILHSIEGQYSPPHACPKEFECGKVGKMSYPFTDYSVPTCGSCLVDCNNPNPRINLGGYEKPPDENWPNFLKHGEKQIQIEVPKNCFAFQKYSLPIIENISFTISPKLTTLLRCDSGMSDLEISYDRKFGCEDEHKFTIYYNYNNTISAYNGFLPPGCLTIQLAFENESFDQDKFYDALAGYIFLTWSDKDPAQKKTKTIVVLGSVIGGIIFLLIICFIIFIIWRQKKRNKYCWKTESNNYRDIEDFLRNYESVPKRFKYYEIKRITSSFKNKLGQGGFGSVFKGYMDGNKNPVAVKVLSISNGTGEEFVNEVASISNTSHVNVVKLLGFCFEYNKRALIYEYMPNGSLEKFIFGGKSTTDNQLGWPTLFKIAIGIARGLEYLHLFCTTRMVHFDIKPHNVLLDQEFCPKISDFGLAKLCSENKSMFSLSGARGTIGYIAPEVVCKNFGGVSHKSDVYSYGMMILEMVGGRKNSDVGCDDSSQVYFPHWIYAQLERNKEIVLPSIINDDDKESATKMIIVSLWCIQTDPSQRPTMSKVVEMLEGNLDILQMPPRPYLFSSANSCVADSSSLQ